MTVPIGTPGFEMPGQRRSDDGGGRWSGAVMSPAERADLQERAMRAWGEARRLLDWADRVVAESSSRREISAAMRAERGRKAADRVEEVIREATPGADGSATPTGVGLVAAHRTEAVGDLHDMLQTRFGRVFAAGDGATAVGLAIVHQPDIGVLDDDLLVIDGLEAATVISLYAPRTRLLLLTDRRARADEAAARGIAVEPSSAPLRDVAAALDRLAG